MVILIFLLVLSKCFVVQPEGLLTGSITVLSAAVGFCPFYTFFLPVCQNPAIRLK